MSEKTKQREVKFRGQTITGEWNYGYVVFTADRAFILLDIGGLNYEVIPETVGQFTGLLDKNGKEIFEGDTVRHISYGNSLFKIMYCISTFRIVNLLNGGNRLMLESQYKNIEIITPNLLQSQSR